MKAAEALSGIASIINEQGVEAIGTFFQIGDPIVTRTQREVGGLLVNTTRFYQKGLNGQPKSLLTYDLKQEPEESPSASL